MNKEKIDWGKINRFLETIGQVKMVKICVITDSEGEECENGAKLIF